MKAWKILLGLVALVVVACGIAFCVHMHHLRTDAAEKQMKAVFGPDYEPR